MKTKTKVLLKMSLIVLLGLLLIPINYQNKAPRTNENIENDTNSIDSSLITKYEQIEAHITYYTPVEIGCFENCITAIGLKPIEGVTIACPKKYKLGTKFIIFGHEYTCQDRTADWIQAKYNPTFDIFLNNYDQAIKNGRTIKGVYIIP